MSGRGWRKWLVIRCTEYLLIKSARHNSPKENFERTLELAPLTLYEREIYRGGGDVS